MHKQTHTRSTTVYAYTYIYAHVHTEKATSFPFVCAFFFFSRRKTRFALAMHTTVVPLLLRLFDHCWTVDAICSLNVSVLLSGHRFAGFFIEVLIFALISWRPKKKSNTQNAALHQLFSSCKSQFCKTRNRRTVTIFQTSMSFATPIGFECVFHIFLCAFFEQTKLVCKCFPSCVRPQRLHFIKTRDAHCVFEAREGWECLLTEPCSFFCYQIVV